jgi:hypothetical protein
MIAAVRRDIFRFLVELPTTTVSCYVADWAQGVEGLNRSALSSKSMRRSAVSRFAVCTVLAVSAPIALTACSSSGASAASRGSTASRASSAASSADAQLKEILRELHTGPPSSTGPSSALSAVVPPITPRLTAIALQPSDLPAGWVGRADIPDPNAAAHAAALVNCTGGRNIYPDETGESHSLDYSLGKATILSAAMSFRSQADVTNGTANLDNPKMASCFQKQVDAQIAGSLPPGATSETLVAFTPGPGGGPSNVIATAVGKDIVTASGKTTIFYIGAAYIVGPLTSAVITFGSPGAPLPTTVTSPLIAKVATRAAAAT